MSLRPSTSAPRRRSRIAAVAIVAVALPLALVGTAAAQPEDDEGGLLGGGGLLSNDSSTQGGGQSLLDIPLDLGPMLSELGAPVPIPGKIPPLGSAEAPPAPSGIRVIKSTFVNDRQVDLVVESTAMGGAQQHVRLLLPKDWYAKPDEKFPVLYLLPGYGDEDNSQSWVNKTDVEEFMADKNVIVASPDSGLAGQYSDWWNYGAGGTPAWETFHTKELPAVLEAEWRGNDKRAVAGLSMGGFGAMHYAARHPGFYAAAASYSGFLDTTAPGMAQFALVTLAEKGEDPFALWGDPILQKKIWDEHNPTNLAGNLEGTELYVSSALGLRGERDSPLLDEVAKVFGFADPLEQARSITLASGLETLAYVGSKSFVDRLNTLNIPVTSYFPPNGTHSWGWWGPELKHSWPVLAKGLGLPAGPNVALPARNGVSDMVSNILGDSSGNTDANENSEDNVGGGGSDGN